MSDNSPHILLLEPYYGGSHRAFLKGLQQNLPFRFTLVSLPARKWKMRMQLAAPWMADETIRLVRAGANFDAILCSTFIDVAALRAFLARAGIHIPLAIYFHENQFAYPNQFEDPSYYQFAALNFTSALAADAVAFNSKYNQESFMDGVAQYLKKSADINIYSKVDELRLKSTVLYPGIDFSSFNGDFPPREQEEQDIPVIVWNHRWEHDKDPETFFQALMELADESIVFKLIVLGQHFASCPEIFTMARKRLERSIIHFGFVTDRREYIRLLHKADIVVSTAVHEFFGIAVLEAVRCGCYPIVPDRLSYQELFPSKYRYAEGTFAEAVLSIITKPPRLEKTEFLALTNQFSWPNLADKYESWLLSLMQ